jgi:hypothetical protein
LTWVFGTATNFIGTAICVADIQITLQGGETIDCLQKVYPLDQNLVAGFAGNVAAGFEMLGVLQRVAHQVASESGRPVDLARVLQLAPTACSKAYAAIPRSLHMGGSELLVAGASFAPEMSYNSAPRVARIRAPSFAVEEVERGTWGSIGSGSDVPGYRTELERLTADAASPLLALEANNPGGFAHAMFITVLSEVFEMPSQPGISKHFHHVTVTANGYQGGTSDRGFFPADGPPREFKMPPVATSWQELQTLLRERTGSAPAWATA